MKKTALCILLSTLALGSTFAANPTATTSFNTTSGAWGVAGNWTSSVSGVPASTMGATITGGRTATIGDGVSYAVAYLGIGNGTLSISNGTLSIAVPTNSYPTSFIGYEVSGTARVYVGSSGGLYTQNTLSIGYANSASGYLTIDGGTFSSSSIVIIGAGTKTGTNTSSGAVSVLNGGYFGATTLSVGHDMGTTGTFTLAGGNVSVSSLLVGNNGNSTSNVYGVGNVYLQKGTVTVSTALTIGATGEGHMTISRLPSTTDSISMTLTVDANVGGGLGAPSTLYIGEGANYTSTRNINLGAWKLADLYGSAAATVSNPSTFTVGTINVGLANYNATANNVSTFVMENASGASCAAINVGTNPARFTGTYTTGFTLQSTGGAGGATISGSILTSGAIAVGNSGTGSLLVQNSTVSMTSGANLIVGQNTYTATPANGQIIYYGSGAGAATLSNTRWNGVATNSRIYAGFGGTGSLAIENSTLSGLSAFYVGSNQYRTMDVSASSTTLGGTTVSTVSQGFGTVTISGSNIDLASATTVSELGVGLGGTGKLVINSGIITTAGALNVGREQAVTISTSTGGVMTTVAQGIVGNGMVIMSGGTLNASYLYLASGIATTSVHAAEKTSVAAMTLSGGTVNIATTSLVANPGNVIVGANSSYSQASLAIYNGAHLNAAGTLSVNSSGTLIFGLKGGNSAFDSSAIIAVAATVSLNTSASYIIDFDGYAATEDKTITLMSYGYKPGTADSIAFTYENLDTSKYSVDGVTWGANAVTLSVSYIPEPATCAALLGLLALALAVRRRR